MAEQQIRFADGAGYERMMGIWSRLAGDVFIDWLAPRPGLVWADIGCGNGAFTELLVERCTPSRVFGVDPSPEQLAYARTRHTAGIAEFTEGSAMDLPLADASVDAAVMALVIFFVPDPKKGIAEMVRIARPGGTIAAYAWDILGGGFPWDVLENAMAADGAPARQPPSVEAAKLDRLEALWTEAGLQSVVTRQITVERTFESFDDFWETARMLPGAVPVLAAMPAAKLAALKERVRAAVHMDGQRVVHSGRANAVKGVVPF
jgi:ubiquinone/menaquinone biosynthesis C-methylase UbiE